MKFKEKSTKTKQRNIAENILKGSGLKNDYNKMCIKIHTKKGSVEEKKALKPKIMIIYKE